MGEGLKGKERDKTTTQLYSLEGLRDRNTTDSLGWGKKEKENRARKMKMTKIGDMWRQYKGKTSLWTSSRTTFAQRSRFKC